MKRTSAAAAIALVLACLTGAPVKASEGCEYRTDPECLIGAPTNVVAQQLSPFDRDGVRVTWDAPERNVHLLSSYWVVFEPWFYDEDNPTQPRFACPRTTTTSCDIPYLPDGDYQFWVLASSVYGSGAYSESPSNVVTVPFSTQKQTKYQRYTRLANEVLTDWVTNTDKVNADGAAKTFTTAPALKEGSRVAKNVCKTFRWANRNGGISKSELEVVAEVVWVQHKATIDLMTGEGISPEQIDSAISAQALVIAAGVQTYCPKYSPVYVQRVMKINRNKFNEYMDLDG